MEKQYLPCAELKKGQLRGSGSGFEKRDFGLSARDFGPLLVLVWFLFAPLPPLIMILIYTRGSKRSSGLFHKKQTRNTTHGTPFALLYLLWC
jgi:hypothetical protein